MLVGKIVCDYTKDLRQLKKVVVTHIPHTYSDKTAEKSEIIVLNVLHKNGMKSRDMVHTVREMASSSYNHVALTGMIVCCCAASPSTSSFYLYQIYLGDLERS